MERAEPEFATSVLPARPGLVANPDGSEAPLIDLQETEFLDSPADVSPPDAMGMLQSDFPELEFLDSPAEAEAATLGSTTLEQTESEQALPDSEYDLEPGPAAAVEPIGGDANEPTQTEALVIGNNPDTELAWAAQSELQQATLNEVDSLSKKDPSRLAQYLRDPDPAVAAAAFSALSVYDPGAASQALLEVVSDETEPMRLQVLDLQLSDPNADQGTVAGILRTALHDADSGIVARAVQTLAGRDDLQALTALAEALGTGDVLTRRLIVESIASNHAAVPLLEFGLSDPDEEVRRTATAILVPSDHPASPVPEEVL